MDSEKSHVDPIATYNMAYIQGWNRGYEDFRDAYYMYAYHQGRQQGYMEGIAAQQQVKKKKTST